MTREKLLQSIRAANQYITKKQREQLWEMVQPLFEKPTFYQIISGSSISKKNQPYGEKLLGKMKEFKKQNERML